MTWENGPIRQIPGTHATQGSPPTPADEPEWMRLSTLVGARAGAGVFRDIRAWHGGTPNLSRDVRAMPNIEYVASWTPELANFTFAQSMPHDLWTELSPHAQRSVSLHQMRVRCVAARRRRDASVGERPQARVRTDGLGSLCKAQIAAIGWVGVAVVLGVRAALFGCQDTQESHPWRSCSAVPASHGPDNRTAPLEQRQIVSRPDTPTLLRARPRCTPSNRRA